MEQLSERLQTPISTAELERRWKAVRAAMERNMERDKIDVLLMQNNSDQMGGYVKYFTDLPATNGYPLTVVFPRDDLMTLVSQGPFGGVNNPPATGDGVRRGVKQWLTTPSYASCVYTANYDPELAATALGEEGLKAYGAMTALQRMGDPAELGAAAAFLASSDSSFMTGSEVAVDGGLAQI